MPLFGAPVFAAAGVGEITEGTPREATSTADSASYTFSSVDIDAAAANRQVVVCYFIGRSGVGAFSLSSLTVGGVSATELVGLMGAGNAYRVGIAIAEVPEGTTADVVVTPSISGNRAAVAVYPIYGASTTALDTGTDTGADPLSDTLTTAKNGMVIACNVGGGGGATTWSNITEDFDAVVETVMLYSSASDLIAAAGSLSPSATTSEVNTYDGAAFVSLKPS